MCNLNTSWELQALKLALKCGYSTSNLIFQENVETPLQNHLLVSLKTSTFHLNEVFICP